MHKPLVDVIMQSNVIKSHLLSDDTQRQKWHGFCNDGITTNIPDIIHLNSEYDGVEFNDLLVTTGAHSLLISPTALMITNFSQRASVQVGRICPDMCAAHHSFMQHKYLLACMPHVACITTHAPMLELVRVQVT